jgi:O-antigen ligase
VVIFAVDENVYLPFHTAKNYALLFFVPLTVFFAFFKRFFIEKAREVHISFLEIVLTVRLLWLVFTNPSVVVHPSGLGFWLLLCLMVFSFSLRQFSFIQKRRLSNRFIRLLWMAGFVQALIGFYQFYAYANIHSQIVKTAMFGSIGSPNGYGLLLSVSLIALLTDISSFKNRNLKILIMLIGFIILAALIMNKSRGALFALICAAVFYSVIVIRRKAAFPKYYARYRKYARFVFAFVILGMAVIFYLLYRIDIESSFGRLMVWRLSAPMVVENPLKGVGYNRYAVEYLDYQAVYFSDPENREHSYKAANLKQAHNEFFQAFFETGVIGGILFFSLWALAAIPFYKAIKQKRISTSQTGLALILAVILIHAFMDSVLHVLPISVMAYAILGLTPRQKIYWRFSLSGKGLWIFLIPFLFLFILMAYKSFIQYPAYQNWQKGYEYNRQGKYAWAVPLYRSALAKLPGQGELLFHLGSALALKGEYSKGIYSLRRAERNFNDRNLQLSMSYAYLKLKNYPKAAYHANKALAMFPDHLAPHLLLGEIYFYMGALKKSRYSLKKCIHSETKIKSSETLQIKRDALNLWQKFFGEKTLDFPSLKK